jgi:hypothetical protein
MYQTEAEFREERKRRLLYLMLGASVLLSTLICSVIMFFALVPTEGTRLVGRDEEFVVGEVYEEAVPRLDVTELMPAAPNWSEDVIFVMKQSDNTYRAYLALDPVTGCKINWRDASHTFVDSTCSQVEYNVHGRNQTQPASLAGAPQNLVELVVNVEGGDVVVRDRLLRRDIR